MSVKRCFALWCRSLGTVVGSSVVFSSRFLTELEADAVSLIANVIIFYIKNKMPRTSSFKGRGSDHLGTNSPKNCRAQYSQNNSTRPRFDWALRRLWTLVLKALMTGGRSEISCQNNFYRIFTLPSISQVEHAGARRSYLLDFNICAARSWTRGARLDRPRKI